MLTEYLTPLSGQELNQGDRPRKVLIKCCQAVVNQPLQAHQTPRHRILVEEEFSPLVFQTKLNISFGELVVSHFPPKEIYLVGKSHGVQHVIDVKRRLKM